MDYLKESMELLKELVAIPSVSTEPAERDIGEYVANYCENLGMDVERQFIDENRFNVIARAKIGNGKGKTVVLNSHMDVVPAADGWDTNPFVLTVKDGKAYGRGATDAKGCLTALMIASRAIISDSGNTNGNLILTAVCDEETNSRGARFLVKNGNIRADYCIVGEPTEAKVAIGHNGSIRPVIKIHGKTAHSSTPELGISAIRIVSYISELVDIRAGELMEIRNPTTGHAAISITMVNGGIKENVLPDYAEIIIDRRMVPGESEKDITDELEKICSKAQDAFPGSKVEIDHYIMTTGPASEVKPDSEIAKIAFSAAEEISKIPQKPFGLTCNTDMNHFIGIGIPTIIIGPNIIDICHMPNEYVELSQLELACKVDENVIRSLMNS